MYVFGQKQRKITNKKTTPFEVVNSLLIQKQIETNK